jgi:hypothetical protein
MKTNVKAPATAMNPTRFPIRLTIGFIPLSSQFAPAADLMFNAARETGTGI